MLASPDTGGTSQRDSISHVPSSGCSSAGSGRAISLGSLPEPQTCIFGTNEFLHTVRTLAKHYQVPHSFIALNSPDGMILKARVGINHSKLSFPSMSHHSVDRDLPIIIEDVRQCEKVKDDTLVIGPPHAMFFAESPLIVHREGGGEESTYIGSICILDTKPRRLSLNDCGALCSAADAIATLYVSLSKHASKPIWEFTQGSLPSLHGGHSRGTIGSLPECTDLADIGLQSVREEVAPARLGTDKSYLSSEESDFEDGYNDTLAQPGQRQTSQESPMAGRKNSVTKNRSRYCTDPGLQRERSSAICSGATPRLLTLLT